MRKMKKYVAWGITALLTVCGILVIYDTFFSTGTLIVFFKKLLNILMPVVYGLFIAYLLSPLVNMLEDRALKPIFRKYLKDGELRNGPIRAVSILISLSVVLLCCYLLINILVPELVRSAMNLFANAENYYHTVAGWVIRIFENNPALETRVLTTLDTYVGDIWDWVMTLIPQAQQILAAVTDGVWSIITFAMDLLIGIIISIYLLYTREGCLANGRRIICALFNDDHSDLILRGLARMNAIFGGFVRGKLLDSLIIGFLCYIGSTILKLPYAPLISVIVGITNVIPFFGPFLGAIPSAFLILLVSPIQCLYFAIFVFLLQQFDGNILGPKILGDSTGISSFWVIVAILVGGGFFGVAGMFFGVPAFACLYTALHTYVEYRLVKRGKSLAVEDYTKERSVHKGHIPPSEEMK